MKRITHDGADIRHKITGRPAECGKIFDVAVAAANGAGHQPGEREIGAVQHGADTAEDALMRFRPLHNPVLAEVGAARFKLRLDEREEGAVEDLSQVRHDAAEGNE